MSGALSALTGSPALAALSGYTRVAAWRGVTFEMLDSSDAVGRRVVRFMFPGRDDTEHEDLGALDAGMQVTALLIGDDYVSRSNRLRAACRQAGPGTLVHPWLGPLQVVLAKPASFAFADNELRVCRAQLQFEPWGASAAPRQDTLGQLLDQLDTWIDQGQLMLAGVLAPLGAAIGLLSMVDTVLARVGAVWDGALSGAGASAARTAAQPSLAALTGSVALDTSSTPNLAAQAAALMAAVPAAVSAASDAGPDPAIGPGPAAVAPAPVDPRAATTLLLAALPALVATSADTPATSVMLLAAQVQAVAEAARAGSLIAWDSRQDALAWRDRIDAALAGVAARAALAAAARPIECGPVWRLARDTRRAWMADLNERIGRLPPVLRLTTQATMSAWDIANAVAGDDPTRIVPALYDLVRRNRVRNPAAVPPGAIEVLAS